MWQKLLLVPCTFAFPLFSNFLQLLKLSLGLSERSFASKFFIDQYQKAALATYLFVLRAASEHHRGLVYFHHGVAEEELRTVLGFSCWKLLCGVFAASFMKVGSMIMPHYFSKATGKKWSKVAGWIVGHKPTRSMTKVEPVGYKVLIWIVNNFSDRAFQQEVLLEARRFFLHEDFIEDSTKVAQTLIQWQVWVDRKKRQIEVTFVQHLLFVTALI
jgi:hypothetical protein